MNTTLLSRPTGTFAPTSSYGDVLDTNVGSTRTLLNNLDYDKWLRDWDREDNYLRVTAAQRQSAEMIVSFLGQWKDKNPELSIELDKEVQKYIRTVATVLPRFQPLDFHLLKVTNEESIFFQVRYGELRAYLELHFGGNEEIELVYNLTKEKDIISAYGGKVEPTLAKLFEALNA
jgi:hypothetical protein